MTNLNEIYYALAILAVLFAGIRWLLKRYSSNLVMRKFVKSVATNHLPHIYHAQKEQARATNAIMEHLGIEDRIELLSDPAIEFVDLEDKGK
jgi:hypothetical protein